MHASTHSTGGTDPLTPSMIGAASAAFVGEPQGVEVIDHNLNSAILPQDWRTLSASISTFSVVDGFARSTTLAVGDGSAYHGVITVARPPISPPAATSAHLTAEVRVAGSTVCRIYVQWLQGTTSL